MILKVHAHLLHADQIQSVKLSKVDQCALVWLITLEVHLIADQNAFLVMNVQQLKLAYVKNAKTHVLELAVQMQNAMLLVTQPIAIVIKVIKVMPLLDAQKFQSLKCLKTRAIHRLVVKMHNARCIMVLLNAPASHHTSEILIRMVAVQNVYTILIVQEILLVFAIIAVIHVLAFVVSMHSVQLSTIYLHVRVNQAIKVIHLLVAEENKYNVSVPFTKRYAHIYTINKNLTSC